MRLELDPDYKHIAKTAIRDWRVSTVWLGVDHSFGDGEPIIFETMIFAPDEYGAELARYDGWIDRYVTEPAALAGHDRLVAELRDALSASDSEIVSLDTPAPDDLSALLSDDRRDDE